MPTLTVTIPAALEAALHKSAEARKTSVDSLLGAALSAFLNVDEHRLYQVSTSTALVEGVSTGAISSAELLRHGDFGLGTFEDLDGEMVILDGTIYQIRGTGEVMARSDDFLVPFAVVSRFHRENSFQATAITSLIALENLCDPHRESDNLFYAFRVDGSFSRVHTRAVNKIPSGTRLLDAAKAQQEFHFENIEGTLVCIWSPTYSSSFNVPGYHFHFISADGKRGGHVLDVAAGQLQIAMQSLCEYDIQLPSRGAFLTTDLSKDPTSDLAKTE